jgi:hypothetical protein
MEIHASPRRRRAARLLLSAAVLAAAIAPVPARALAVEDSTHFSVEQGSVTVPQPPAAPAVPSPALGGEAQAISTRMSDFAVSDASGTGQGYALTVSGNDAPGMSPVLKQYCPDQACGAVPGPGFVPEGTVLPSDSLLLDSSGAIFRPQAGTTGAAPAHECDLGCFVDAPPRAPSKVVAAGIGAGMGTFRTDDFSGSSLRLQTPSAVNRLQAGEVYWVDLSWTLGTGP